MKKWFINLHHGLGVLYYLIPSLIYKKLKRYKQFEKYRRKARKHLDLMY
jgi:hypothetical protein